MVTVRFNVLCGLGFCFGIWLFFSAFRRLSLRRAVEDTPRAKVRSAAVGRCELRGRVRALPAPLIGPFSGLPCVWFRWKVEEEHQNSKGGSSWTTLGEGRSDQAFLLEDETGSLRVDPEGAVVESGEAFVYRSGFLGGKEAPAGPQTYVWLGSQGLFARNRRLSEWTLLADADVFLLGVLRIVPAAEGAAEQKVIAKGLRGEDFFISTRDRDEVEKELDVSIWGRLLGGALLALACAAAAVAFSRGG